MTINCNGQLIDFETPKIMGILNVNPDSFYDGGNYQSDKEVLKQTEKMLKEGAHFIDVGGASSKLNAPVVTPDVESKRVVGVVASIVKEFPEVVVSIDTFHATVAQQAIDVGAAMVNDISSGKLDAEMLKTVGAAKVPYVMMHMKGNPQNMQSQTQYNDLPKEIVYFFSERIAEAKKHGINDLILDVGFGFSKEINQNFELLKNLGTIGSVLKLPVLAGISRKSMIYKTLEIDPSEALNGTTALHMVALQNGAKILRVHDVKQARECIALYQKIR